MPAGARPGHFAEETVTPETGAGPASSQPWVATGASNADAS